MNWLDILRSEWRTIVRETCVVVGFIFSATVAFHLAIPMAWDLMA